ncbi:hypothetical protein HDU98_007467, partial [Podochytrium sp. JEL0797]
AARSTQMIKTEGSFSARYTDQQWRRMLLSPTSSSMSLTFEHHASATVVETPKRWSLSSLSSGIEMAMKDKTHPSFFDN